MIFRTKSTGSKGGIVPAFFVLLLLLSIGALAQELPDTIRGYKVHQDKISVNTSTSNSQASVRVGSPEIVDVSPTGITLDVPAEFTAANQSGKVEMITFHDLKVNGIKVEPEDYSHKFVFKKGEKVIVPKPVRISVPVSGLVKATWQEVRENRAEWVVTGRVFVFGKFRRYGFYHKRVVPIDLNLNIENPLHRK